MDKPEALRLADELTRYLGCGGTASQAAAELRRLHTLLEAEQALHQRTTYPELRRLHAQRDALLEALAVVLLEAEHTLLEPTRRKARAAIKAAEEGE